MRRIMRSRVFKGRKFTTLALAGGIQLILSLPFKTVYFIFNMCFGKHNYFNISSDKEIDFNL